ncbi:hypothetical protein R3P38DRAFT_2558291, partial [Favolaschia claudopus]
FPGRVTPTALGKTAGTPELLGLHYFVALNTGISPKWYFTSTTGKPSAYVIGAKVGDIPAPSNPANNVDWLALNRAEGTLADRIFRVDTVGGQPPVSCVPGSTPISVKYTAKYYLY